MTANTHMGLRWINFKQTYRHKDAEDLKLSREKQEVVSYVGAKQVVATQPQGTYVNK